MTMHAVDRLGAVRASLADLHRVEAELVEEIKRTLLAEGVASLEGELFRASLSIAERVSINQAGGELFRQVYPIGERPDLYARTLVESLRVTARTGEPAKVAA